MTPAPGGRRIKMRITANNLKSAKTKTVEVKDVTVLTGGNGAGKTTIARTPYWVITGKGLPSAVDGTAPEGTVEFGDTTISRTKAKTTTISVNGNKITEKALEDVLAQRGLPLNVLASLYAPTTTLEAEDLLRAAKLKLTPDKVVDLMAPLDLPEEAELRKALTDIGSEEVSLKDISKLEKLFVEKRKNLKKEVKALEARVSNEEIDETALNEKSARLNVELEKLYAVKGKADAEKRMRELLERTANELSSLQEVKARLLGVVGDEAKAQEELVELSAQEMESERKIFKANEKEKSLETELAAKNAELRKASSVLSGKKGEIAGLSKMLEALKTVKTCPLCPSMPCTADKTEAIKKLESDLAELNEAITKAESEEALLVIIAEGIKSDMALSKDEIAKENEKLREISKKLSEIKLRMSDIQRNKERLAEIDKEISEKQTSLSAQPSPSVTEGKDLDGEIARLKAELRDIEAKLSRKAENNKTLKELSLKKLDCEVTDTVVRKLQGLPEVISAKVTAPLAKVANATIGQLLNGWSVEFAPDGNITVEVNGKKFPREDISGGEEIILNYVLKVVLARLIGHDVIIVDDCDRLDKSHFEALVKVSQAAAGINTLLVSCNGNDIPAGVNIVKI